MAMLDEYIASKGLTKFEWGTHDCAHFAAGWAQLAAGHSYLANLPKWKTLRESLRVIKNLGGLEAATTAELGAPFEGVPKDGDIALLPVKLGGLCIVYGAYAVGPSATVGLAFFPFTDAQKFWRLPCQTSQK